MREREREREELESCVCMYAKRERHKEEDIWERKKMIERESERNFVYISSQSVKSDFSSICWQAFVAGAYFCQVCFAHYSWGLFQNFWKQNEIKTHFCAKFE